LPPKILIVDDCTIDRIIATQALQENNYQICEAKTSKQAFELIHKEKPDLILLDIRMPDINGFEVCKHLKSKSRLKNIPVIFLTAAEDFASKKQGFAIGADDYITKPVDFDNLLKRIEQILNMKKEQEKLRKKVAKITPLTKELIQKEKELIIKQIYVALHHEIRNPLTTILIGSQIMESSTKLQEEEKKVVTEISKCAKRLKEVMDSLCNMKNIYIDDYIDETKMLKINNN
jgi:DNA-binding response OmpR family regulator